MQGAVVRQRVALLKLAQGLRGAINRTCWKLMLLVLMLDIYACIDAGSMRQRVALWRLAEAFRAPPTGCSGG